MEGIWEWYLTAGLITFGLVWLGASILAVVALIFDCWAERETTLRKPLPELPATEQESPNGQSNPKPMSCGTTTAATRLAQDAWRGYR